MDWWKIYSFTRFVAENGKKMRWKQVWPDLVKQKAGTSFIYIYATYKCILFAIIGVQKRWPSFWCTAIVKVCIFSCFSSCTEFYLHCLYSELKYMGFDFILEKRDWWGGNGCQIQIWDTFIKATAGYQEITIFCRLSAPTSAAASSAGRRCCRSRHLHRHHHLHCLSQHHPNCPRYSRCPTIQGKSGRYIVPEMFQTPSPSPPQPM